MQRRQFIAMAAAGAAGLAWPPAAPAAGPVPPSSLASPRLLDVMGDPALVRELGRRYRTLVPTEDDAGILAQVILPEPRRAPQSSLDDGLAAQVQQDFAAGRTVTVHGWILAITEARQCALYSLQHA